MVRIDLLRFIDVSTGRSPQVLRGWIINYSGDQYFNHGGLFPNVRTMAKDVQQNTARRESERLDIV